MPFINTMTNVPVSHEKRDRIKTAFGKAISTLNKTEDYLMVGFQDNYTLYFGGKECARAAYVEVSVLGSVPSQLSDKLTAQICDILLEELSIPGEKVYIKYHGVSDWGWNGHNF